MRGFPRQSRSSLVGRTGHRPRATGRRPRAAGHGPREGRRGAWAMAEVAILGGFGIWQMDSRHSAGPICSSRLDPNGVEGRRSKVEGGGSKAGGRRSEVGGRRWKGLESRCARPIPLSRQHPPARESHSPERKGACLRGFPPGWAICPGFRPSGFGLRASGFGLRASARPLPLPRPIGVEGFPKSCRPCHAHQPWAVSHASWIVGHGSWVMGRVAHPGWVSGYGRTRRCDGQARGRCDGYDGILRGSC